MKYILDRIGGLRGALRGMVEGLAATAYLAAVYLVLCATL